MNRETLATEEPVVLQEISTPDLNALIDYGVLGLFCAVAFWVLGGWVRSQLTQNSEIAQKFIDYLQQDKARMSERDEMYAKSIHELSRSVEAMKEALEWLRESVEQERDE